MAESEIKVSQELIEKRVPITRENVKYQGGGGGAVNSVNGQTGDVVLTAEDVGALPDTTEIPTNVSELTNDAGYQTASEVASAVAGEATLRQSADNNLQTQIDAISASSDVTDIVGTYAELQAYDTSTLGDKDIIKVLQDESRNDETTYYRWSTTTQTFTLIGEEGPYYTKSQADGRFVAQTTYATDKAAIEAAIGTKQDELTAGNNIQISGSVISATDTTYSDFTGTDGTSAGTAGLVPAPATTDADKFLKSDGTWDTVAAGPTVVQTTGTSTTDVMSQDATTKMIWPAVADATVVAIGGTTNAAGAAYSHSQVAIRGAATGQYSTAINGRATGPGSIAIGENLNDKAAATDSNTIAIGGYARASSSSSIAIGASASTESYDYSIALGTNARNGRQYEVSLGRGGAGDPTRFIANVTDPSLPQDAATKNYVDNVAISFAAISGASAPTTATEGEYVGQLYYDTTNDAMYYLSSIDDTQTPVEYNWSTFGGGGPTVVQTTGTSTTDVMSQDATTKMIYPRISQRPYQVAFAGGTVSNQAASNGMAVGQNALVNGGYGGIALGREAQVTSSTNRNVALGDYSISSVNRNEVSFGSGSGVSSLWNVPTRFLTNVTDPSLPQDAATKNYVDGAILRSGTAAPTTATIGSVGALYAYVESGTGHLAICTDVTGGTYTWQTLV